MALREASTIRRAGRRCTQIAWAMHGYSWTLGLLPNGQSAWPFARSCCGQVASHYMQRLHST